MARNTLPKLSDFTDQAAAILAASKARRADLRMEVEDGDEDKGAPGSEDDDDEEDDDDADESGDDEGKDDKKDSDKKDKDEDKVDRAEYERVRKHRAAADRKAADLQRQLDELRAGKSSDDKKDDKKDEKPAGPSERETKLEQETRRLKLENAFLSANKYAWHDPADALRLADLSDVEIEEDGTVIGLKEALRKLATEKPHLIKKAEGDGDKNGPSGSPNNGRRKGEAKKPDRESLAKTYPVLRNMR